jgi:hypothetical protein
MQKESQSMIRNFKALGLAFVAIFALSALVASAAQAGEFMINPETAKIKASGGTQTFKTTSGNVVCGEASGEATEFNANEVTGINIKYNNVGSTTCNGPFGTSPTIKTEGCHYKFKPGETEAGNPDMTTGTVELSSCTAGSIVVSAPGCTIKVPNGQTFTGITYKNTTEQSPDDVDVTATVANIHYSHEGFLCGSGSAETGTYEGEITVRAFNSAGTQVSLTVT